MKYRVLFVDDDPLVLQGLRRTLYSLREEWEMEFVDSGEKALKLMAERPCKVVVSDMRMPGMSGAELLNRVMQAHPQTIRLILSGHADNELIMKCVGATHQYLAKPCNAVTLKATIQRATALEERLQNESLRQFTARMEYLPSLPALYQEIIRKLQMPDVGLDEITNIVSQDLGMTAELLKLVNSAFFGLPRVICSPSEAVAYLGLDTLKGLVLSAQAFNQLRSEIRTDFSVEQLWVHSLRTAAAARAIAQAEHASSALVEECFTAGLLHDTGKLVFAANCGSEYDGVLRQAAAEKLPLAEVEQRVFCATHAELGGYLLSLWGLPVPLVETVTLHHHPELCVMPAFGSLVAVHVANVLVQENTSIPGSPLNLPHLETLGLAEHLPGWRAAVQSILNPENKS